MLGKVHVYVCSVASACLTLCDPMNCSPPLSSVHEILHTRILEWVAMSSPGDLPDPGIKPAPPASPVLQVDSFIHWVTWEVQEKYALNPYFQFWFTASWWKQVTKQKNKTKTKQKEAAISMGPTTFFCSKREPKLPHSGAQLHHTGIYSIWAWNNPKTRANAGMWNEVLYGLSAYFSWTSQVT